MTGADNNTPAKQELNLTRKEIVTKDDYGFGIIGQHTETRWFVETNDGFDGTAQGYGYKSPQALYKAYWYFKNSKKRHKQTQDVRAFLKQHAAAKKILDEYFSDEVCFYRAKDGAKPSFADLLRHAQDDTQATRELSASKPLWRAFHKHYMAR